MGQMDDCSTAHSSVLATDGGGGGRFPSRGGRGRGRGGTAGRGFVPARGRGEANDRSGGKVAVDAHTEGDENTGTEILEEELDKEASDTAAKGSAPNLNVAPGPLSENAVDSGNSHGVTAEKEGV